MTDLEIAQQINALKAERAQLEESTQRRIREIKTDLEKLQTSFNVRSVGLDEDKIRLALTVIEVTGKYEREGGCVAKAVASLAKNDSYMNRIAIAVKDYAQFSGQGCDCEYGYGPKHGSHVFTVGLTRDARKRELTEEERDAAIYYLMRLQQIQEAQRQAAACI